MKENIQLPDNAIPNDYLSIINDLKKQIYEKEMVIEQYKEEKSQLETNVSELEDLMT